MLSTEHVENDFFALAMKQFWKHCQKITDGVQIVSPYSHVLVKPAGQVVWSPILRNQQYFISGSAHFAITLNSQSNYFIY